MLSLFLTACSSITRMLPQGPALDAAARAAFVEAPSGAAYSGEPLTPFPVLPVVVFGAKYDLDLVIISQHPEWNMHEYARIITPDGPVWFAKDARESTMMQSYIADLPGITSYMPEGPIQRKYYPVEVVDRSTAEWLDIELRYENIDGEPVEVTYQGKPPRPNQKKRNGSVMGHSPQVLAVLDLPSRVFGRRATMRINGEPYKVKRALGLVPFQLALTQTQGGLASHALRLEPTWDEGLEVEASAFATPGEMEDANEPQQGGPAFDAVFFMPDGDAVRRHWEVEEFGDYVHAKQVSEMRTLSYRFRKGERGSRELVSATVEQFGEETPVTHVVFSPALPDLGHRFHGTVHGRFAIDVNGQEGHAVGRVESTWTEEGPVIKLIPEAPWWTTDRPLTGHFLLTEDGGVDVRIEVAREDEATSPTPGPGRTGSKAR